MFFSIKTEIREPDAKTFLFTAQKTMYGGKHIAAGDRLFIFASENEGGTGLIAVGIVSTATLLPKRLGVSRATPCVSVSVAHLSRIKKPLGRADLKAFKQWNDGQPETELNFKLYRQATNKIVALSEKTAEFLEEFF